MTTKRNEHFSLLKTVKLQQAPLWKRAPVNSRTFFVCFPGSLFSFEQTGLFPAHLFCISRTCSRSPERLDCMPLHLLTRSCTSRLFTAKTRQSPEIPCRRICAAPEDLFRRWAFRSAPALGFRKWQRNLSARRESNGAAAFEHQSRDRRLLSDTWHSCHPPPSERQLRSPPPPQTLQSIGSARLGSGASAFRPRRPWQDDA